MFISEMAERAKLLVNFCISKSHSSRKCTNKIAVTQGVGKHAVGKLRKATPMKIPIEDNKNSACPRLQQQGSWRRRRSSRRAGEQKGGRLDFSSSVTGANRILAATCQTFHF